MLLGGYVGQEQIHFGERALRLPAKNAPEAAVRVVRRFADEREAGEAFRAWIDRSGGVEGDRRGPPGPRRVPDSRGRARTSTSTTARPARTSPRPASRSARHDAISPPICRACRTSPTRSWPTSTASSSTCPRRRSSSGRSTRFAPHLCLSASMTDAVLIDLATKVDPAHRGRVHRHRLPLPRDARDGRGGAPPLRAQPAHDDRRPPGRGAVAGRPGELLLGGQGRPARPGPRRQGGLDERAAPRRGRHAGTRPRSWPATCAAW